MNESRLTKEIGVWSQGGRRFLDKNREYSEKGRSMKILINVVMRQEGSLSYKEAISNPKVES